MTDHCPECGCLLDDPKNHSDPMRRWFFVTIHKTWASLPDHIAARFPSSEHLRKEALCRIGWCEVKVVTAGTKAATESIAAMCRHLDSYAIVDVSGTVVTVFTARSIAKRACPKDRFKEISDKVMDWLSQLVGADVTEAA